MTTDARLPSLKLVAPGGADRLRRARLSAGFATATSAARSHGWPTWTYLAREKGNRPFGAEVAEIYAKAFRVPMEYILSGTLSWPSPGLDLSDRDRLGIMASAEERSILAQVKALSEKFPRPGPKQRLTLARLMAGFDATSHAAKYFGFGPSTYTAHENGQNNISASFGEIYAQAFGVLSEWLMYGTLPSGLPLQNGWTEQRWEKALQFGEFNNLPMRDAGRRGSTKHVRLLLQQNRSNTVKRRHDIEVLHPVWIDAWPKPGHERDAEEISIVLEANTGRLVAIEVDAVTATGTFVRKGDVLAVDTTDVIAAEGGLFVAQKDSAYILLDGAATSTDPSVRIIGRAVLMQTRRLTI